MQKHSLVGLATLVLLGGLSGCGGGNDDEGRPARPVRHQVVDFGGSGATRTFSGTAETGRIVNLSFRSSGVITRFDVRVGQSVRRGDLLAGLDNVAARLAYEQSVSQLNSAASQMNTAKLALDRVRALYEKGTAALSEYESAKNSFRTAEASHQSAQRSVEIQQEQIRYGFIYSPESGTIAAVNAELNENVQAGQTVAVLNAGADMEIALGLPESVINRISEGMDVEVAFPALPEASFSGVVSEVAPSVEATTATYPVQIRVRDPSESIRTGMAADVTFSFDDASGAADVLVVPASAVAEDDQGRFVFVIEEGGEGEGTVRKQHVAIGQLTHEGFEIRDGLTRGQTIATAGLQTLLDGQRVRLR